MLDIEGQIDYWRRGSEEDWEVAVRLVRDGKSRHGLLFAHLALEKALKALVCRHTRDVRTSDSQPDPSGRISRPGIG